MRVECILFGGTVHPLKNRRNDQKTELMLLTLADVQDWFELSAEASRIARDKVSEVIQEVVRK